MAISMSGASISDDSRQALKSSSIDGSFAGGTANGGGARLAGVTEDFAKAVSLAIDTYKGDVQRAIDNINTADSGVAFKGASLKSALDNFITAVKEVANSYLEKLSAAEKQIVDSVAAAYQTQDADLSSSLGADQGSLESNI